MSYQSISVKEAVNAISAPVNGWFLPPVQRPYVWGSRYENEKYICKLFDSILRGYPIGGIIVWVCDKEMPYREFITDYIVNDPASFVDKGLWGRKDKWLIYDGQQRLQTLYSCLKYTLNNKILGFNLLFDLSESHEDVEETGFYFIEKNAEIKATSIRMNELFVQIDHEKTNFRKALLKKCESLNINDSQEILIENNLDKLWDIFVKTDVKSLAFFPIQTIDENEVNDIFQRLNTGGVPLSQGDLLFSRIKDSNYEFEEILQGFSKRIFDVTNKGYLFDSYQILQLINLIIKGSTRIDPERITESEIKKYVSIWSELESPLLSFFSDFIWESFKINNHSIVPKKLALLPIMVYFYIAYKKNTLFKNFDNNILMDLKKYFITSQINDWNLQSIVDNFSRILFEQNDKSQAPIFPFNDFKNYIDKNKIRNIDIYEKAFVDYEWFSLKILTPTRIYNFEPDSKGRFNPEIDHIFPKKLKDQPDDYYSSVDIIWNMQPVKGEVNNYKRRKNPFEFFNSVEGSKYLKDYDFIVDINNSLWNQPVAFINNRKNIMIDYLKNTYDIILK